MLNPGTRPLPMSYLLFPRGEAPTPYLMALTDREVRTALYHMKLVDKLSTRHGDLQEIAFAGYRFSRPAAECSYHELNAIAESAVLGCHVHPDVARFFDPPESHPRVLLHVQPGLCYPADDGRGPVEACWLNLAYCRLATAPCRDVPSLFRELVDTAPFAAVDILESGLVLHGSAEAVRDVVPLLTINDLSPLFEEADQDVRERAIAALGALRRLGVER